MNGCIRRCGTGNCFADVNVPGSSKGDILVRGIPIEGNACGDFPGGFGNFKDSGHRKGPQSSGGDIQSGNADKRFQNNDFSGSNGFGRTVIKGFALMDIWLDHKVFSKF